MKKSKKKKKKKKIISPRNAIHAEILLTTSDYTRRPSVLQGDDINTSHSAAQRRKQKTAENRATNPAFKKLT